MSGEPLVDAQRLIRDNCDLAKFVAAVVPIDPRSLAKWARGEGVTSRLRGAICAALNQLASVEVSASAVGVLADVRELTRTLRRRS